MNNFEQDGECLWEIKNLQEYANGYELLTREEEYALTTMYYDLKTNLIPMFIRNRLDLKWLVYLVCRKMLIEKEMINKNLRLVFSSARKQSYVGRGLTVYDRILAGLDGLIYCLRSKFNPYLGFKFSTYATRWIKQRIGKAIEKYGSLVKTSGNIKGLQSKIRMVVREYCSDTKNEGRKPSAEIISTLLAAKYDGLEISPERVAELGRIGWNHLSLDETTEDSTMSLMDHLAASEGFLPEETSIKSEMSIKLRDIISRLETNEALVITMKYGLLDDIPKSNKQIAGLLLLNQKEYTTLENNAMNNLKRLIPNDFKDFLE